VPPTEEGKNQLGELAEQAAKELFFEIKERIAVYKEPAVVDEEKSREGMMTPQESALAEPITESINATNTLQDGMISEPAKDYTPKKVDRAELKSEQNSFMRAVTQVVIGFPSFAEAGAGVRIGVLFGEHFLVYTGIGVVGIAAWASDHIATPSFGLGAVFEVNTIGVQVEAFDLSDEESMAPITLQYIRDMGEPGAWSAIFGVGISIHSQMDYSSSAYPYSYSAEEPFANLGMAYTF
jgi:hypothetical protein